MIWIVGGCIAVGLVLCGIAYGTVRSSNPDNRSAAPLYWLPGLVLIGGAVVLAIVNAAVKALL